MKTKAPEKPKQRIWLTSTQLQQLKIEIRKMKKQLAMLEEIMNDQKFIWKKYGISK